MPKAIFMVVLIWAYTIPWAVFPLLEFWGRFVPGLCVYYFIIIEAHYDASLLFTVSSNLSSKQS